jgi:integrase
VFRDKANNCNGKSDNLEIFSDDEIKRFVETANKKYSDGTPMYVNSGLFIIMLNLGLRMGEASALKWSDYDKKEKTLGIYSSIIQHRDDDGKQIIREQKSVKTKHSERVLKMNDKAIEAIEAMTDIRNGEYIFCTKDGKPLRPRNIQRTLDAILTRAGIPHKSTHVFRHTFASKLFAQGVNVRIVSELLGHTDVKTTENTYIKVMKKQRASVMEAVNLY